VSARDLAIGAKLPRHGVIIQLERGPLLRPREDLCVLLVNIVMPQQRQCQRSVNAAKPDVKAPSRQCESRGADRARLAPIEHAFTK
jgi:hypothetical protein